MWKRLWNNVTNASIQLRTTFLIIFIVAVTVLANFFSSSYFTNQSLTKTMEQDLSFAVGIANSLTGTQMNLMKAEAMVVAQHLSAASSDDQLHDAMIQQYSEHQDVTALEIFDRNGVIASYSEPQHSHDIDVTAYIDLVYEGSTIISSPFFCPEHNEYVMNVYTPMPGERVLAVTMPGERFSNMLSAHKLWQSGTIFMLNGEGMFIGTADEDIVLAVTNYIDESQTSTDPNVQAMSGLIQEILSNDEGVTRYQYDGEEHICAYSRISDSALGWCVAVTAPINESPQADASEGQLYSAILFIIVGAIAAFFLSRLLTSPFKRIEEQNLALESANRTIKKQTESILEESARVNVMLDSTPLSSRLWNRDYRVIACNNASVALFKMNSKQEYMDSYFDLAPPTQPDGQSSKAKVIAMVKDAFENGRCTYNYIYQLRDGEQIPAELTLVRVPYEDDYAVASYARDLREEKKMISEIEEKTQQLEVALEDAEQANLAKNDFLAKMSHEIRTPLNAVIGLSELSLGEDKLSDETEQNLEKIYGAGSTILSIVNDILDISKIESGNFESNLEQYDTPSFINDTVSINIVRIGEKPIEFRLVVDENLPALLYGDDLRVKQIFNNLLSNAFKYTNTGFVEWRITSEYSGDKLYIISSIEDSGIGIKEKDLQNLFADYSQVDTKTNRNVEGTGLGLSIAKRLVERMDGNISVESEYGKGTTFTVRIRQDRVSDKVIGKDVAANLMSLRYAITRQSRNKMMRRISMPYAHILIVDDTDTNLDVARGMMKPYGMKIDCVKSGLEAIELIRSGTPHYDAIFMDHMMPNMDGVEATQIIRDKLGTDYARNIPIIALTANAISGNEEMFLAHGFQAFLSKPVDIMRLDSILRKWVRNKAMEAPGTAAADEVEPTDDQRTLRELSIEGLDIDKALEQFSDDEETYLEVLSTYAANTKTLLDKLGDCLAQKNLKDYDVIVHGIKGSSYSICAQEVGHAAEELEHMAKDYDIDAVSAKHPEFIKLTLALLERIDGALDSLAGVYDGDDDLEEADIPDPKILQALKNACRSYDMDGVDAAMSELEKRSYTRDGALIAWLRRQVDDMAFENIYEGDWPRSG